jgi:hypothetical protein
MGVYKFSDASSLASDKVSYKSMLAGNTTWVAWAPLGGYDALSTITVPSGGMSSVTFSAIPNTYRHLQIRCIARSDSGTATSLSFTFNGDTNNANYYARHLVFGDGTTAASINNATLTGITGGSVAPSTTSLVAPNIIDALDYTSTTENKTLRIFGGLDANGSGSVGLGSGLWLNNSAITSITITSFGGSNFTQHSQFSLYGVR